MTIKDIINKRANGEDVPDFKYDGRVYKSENEYGYITDDEGDSLLETICTDFSNLNNEVEIIKKKNRVTKEDIDKILAKTFIKVEKYGDKTTVLMATLPNDFVIVVSSSCIDPINYDSTVGEKNCMNKLVDKIYELEGYRLQCEISVGGKNE